MLNVNTISFNGEKAVINSYSNERLLIQSMENQLAEWKARYPNAIVQTERLSTSETVALVAAGRAKGDHLYNHAYAIGEASKA